MELKLRLSASADTDGTATISVTPRGAVRWIIRQISVEMDTDITSVVGELRDGDWLVSPFIAHADALTEDPPVILVPGETLHVIWRGAAAGDVARAWIVGDQEPQSQ